MIRIKENQKSKLLYLLKILWEETDEAHPMSARAIAERLKSYGIVCERKTVYTDMEELSEFGYDIIRTGKGAYLGARQFELAELKLLADAVQSSRFITEKKSEELISKLSALLGRYDAASLKRQVVVENRVKSMNESIYYNVDALFEAINSDCQISFFYGEWNRDKQMKYRRDGKRYIISPWFLQWEDERYYLIGFDEAEGKMKHFRVDKLLKIELLPDRRLGRELSEGIDMAGYGNRHFGMYHGKEATVTLIFDNDMAGVVIDRFGKDVWMHGEDDAHFRITADIAVSNQFFGWLAALGNKVEIVEPLWVKNEYRKLLEDVLVKIKEEKIC